MISTTPLAERVRPKKIENIIGQDHIIGPNKPLRLAIEKGYLTSCIFWGPPGVGKTTLARAMANSLDRTFYFMSAVDAGVKQVREIIEKAKKHTLLGRHSAVLFIDEIHRFNKSQQDALLGAVEQGVLTLVGATTENPSFEVNAALLSRSEVYVLELLKPKALTVILKNAIVKDGYLKTLHIKLNETDALFKLSGGDARRMLNTFEQVINHQNGPNYLLTNNLVEEVVQQKQVRYDKNGEEHYDIISAFIKSIRGSDPNAAVYYLARMIEGGEDPKFIARRLLILASEDIGNANPTALVLANSTAQAVQFIGYPECRITLSQLVCYLAASPKSNASYMAINKAQKTVRDTGNLSVPLTLRNAPTALMKNLNYGKNYLYAHNYPNNFINQEFLPEEIEGQVFYNPGDNARESKIRESLKLKWKEKYGY